ncbi:histone PARylation factor 1 isoform X1 [Hylaeus anthracinus]|uniref:histone PARylation factor 1 isoform X1 n=1 Tax=Hylaeus anthracinus TaxID=313031 RepID=UPI0023B933C6|nr:histone PARylation factor 1 isoform X1 [Hylaeus anthracinus]
MDSEQEQYKAYQEDPRIPCRFGVKCYQKNPIHHKTYKHPPAKDTQKIVKRTQKRKEPSKRKERSENGTSPSPEKKFQKRCDSTIDESSADKDIEHTANNTVNNDKENSEIVEDESSTQALESIKSSIDCITIASLLKDCNVNIESGTLLPPDAQTVISHLFLTEMPEDFFQFFEFLQSISKDDPLNALKDIHLQLVGPYDVFEKKFFNLKVCDKKTLLRHWRYYYDPPEFQTVVKVDDKDGLHFGYWRDEPSKMPVFVAMNKENVNCTIAPVAENLFGMLDWFIAEKLKQANPFKKMSITLLQQKLKRYAREKNIALDKQTSNMQAREKKVVAKTFHKAGIVVPYDRKTEVGYRKLAVTDHELKQILEQIENASTSEAKKISISKIEEVIRLATIAADEYDFGTCLELGHDLFSSGLPFVHNKALNMLSLAYNLLQREEFSEIAGAHLEDRRHGSNLSVVT